MKIFNQSSEGVVLKDLTQSGKTITIIAEPMDDDCSEWRLAIKGKNNHYTNWTVFFSTSDSAINAGVAAVKREGIAEFYSGPNFNG